MDVAVGVGTGVLVHVGIGVRVGVGVAVWVWSMVGTTKTGAVGDAHLAADRDGVAVAGTTGSGSGPAHWTSHTRASVRARANNCVARRPSLFRSSGVGGALLIVKQRACEQAW